MRRALLIMGKAPRPGRAKTRLAPSVSLADAAELACAFLLDTIETGLSLGWECVSVIHPAEPDEAILLGRIVPHEVALWAQPGVGLGDALSGAFAAHFALGFERVVLVDSDSPTLPAHVLAEACAGLAACDVTIGPSADGGYYLLGLRAPCARLFEDIAWSTARVYQQTLERAHGLHVLALPEWYDVDEAADLARLQADLAVQPPAVAPRTRAALGRAQARRPVG